MKKHFFYFLSFAFAATALKANAQTGDLKKTDKGSFYKIYTANTGEKAKLNDVITFNFIQKTDKDSVLFSSYTAGRPAQAQIQEWRALGDMMDIFPLLAVKDSALVKIPADSVFKGHEEARPPFFPKGSYLTFIIKMEKIQSLNEAIAERNAGLEKLKQAEAADRDKYIAAHNLKPITTASGLKYIITSPSAKRKPLAGDTVLVNYTGKTLNDKVFDSSIEANAKAAGLEQPGRTYEPISVVLGEGRVIQGWEEGLLLLNEGSKATVIIPSSLGYGDRGQGPAIPGYSTLIFDLELVKVKPGKHVAPKPAAVKGPVKKAGVKKPVAKKKN
ncbi:FKBP-type peptidyl-prolyl cis-trans isomerase [Mucilaginibacter oryzae]|uniref:peptidylprolyl isomerase n=1 Tax=Mucilaginibacter oryzae TaxID=468058 RepID=A0A316GYX3_9SPHI|nr:FKBP-type peptidyl-prolyl cis-trans isomerase [Mucilaginibacter oryzae]PWK70048.1 FKBP-type peptidyl-prolyl cis-trans isomerase [Mucilaginibacter oryzae]